jgi:hypothetical protein
MLLPDQPGHRTVKQVSTLKEGIRMDKKQIQALKRLAPKLSALRKALRGEERKILDEMVSAYQSEVNAHSATVGQKSTAKTPEISMHSASVGQKTGSKTPIKTSEVSLHSASVTQKNAGMKTPEVDSQKSLGRASIDLRKDVYEVNIL